MKNTVLITGGAGFIGSHLSERLLQAGFRVVILDNFNDYYAPALKEENLRELKAQAQTIKAATDLVDIRGDIRDQGLIERIFTEYRPSLVIHIAAMAGVRNSILYPLLYEEVNIRGTLILLESCKKFEIKNIIFASSSSVYGSNPKTPFSETDDVSHPISPYAATKLSGEEHCHTYYHLYGMSIVCLRFFTVYGARQRPDLAIRKFSELISQGKPLPIFGDGSSRRDYTYINDIINGIILAKEWLERQSLPAYEIFNLGESRTVNLLYLIELIEKNLGAKAKLNFQPPAPGDLAITYADISKARAILGYNPSTPIEDGIAAFCRWFKGSSRA